jgi:CheY-like chemotaxis protein
LFLDILGRLPVRVDTARDGSEAMRMVLDGNYDLVISDLKMPEMDGPTLYKEMLRQKPEMVRRLVFTTGDLASSSSNDFLEATRLPVIRKPIDVREVEEIVTRAGRRPTEN